MKAKHLILTLAAVAGLSVACKPKDEPLPAASIAINPSALTFEKEGGSQTLTVAATRDWTVSNDADWIAVEPKSGKASNDARTVTVKVLENNGVDREASVKFTIGLDAKTLSVKQAGKVAVVTGDGTKASPYSVAKAVEVVSALAADTETEKPVYVKGIISSIKSVETAQFGNANYYISDDGSRSGAQLYIFQSYYLGNVKFTAQDQIKAGDEVIIYGKLVNYKGNTPETVGKGSSCIYSLNGKVVEPADPNTAASKTVKDFIAAADGSNYYRLKGTVSKFNAQYCSFDLTDETGTIVVWSVANKTDWVDKIKDGGTVELAGKYELYTNATTGETKHEVVNAVIFSFTEAPVTPAEKMSVGDATKAADGKNVILENVLVYAKNKSAVVVGDATGFIVVYNKDGVNANVGDKITVEGAIGPYGGLKQVTSPKITAGTTGNALTYPAAKEIASINDYKPAATAPEYVTLKGTLKVSGNYYNIVVDGADRQGSIQAPLDGAVPADLNGKPVVVTGFFSGFAGTGDKYVNIMMTKIETTAGSFLSADKTAITVEPTATSATFNITSNVDWTAKAETAGVTLDKTSGNGNATVTATFPANTSTTADVVMTITLSGTGVNPVTVTITQKKVIAALTHPLTTNIPEADFTVSKENSSYIDGKVTVNGSTDQYFALKLGTSKKSGKATVKLPAGTKRIGFFAVGWKGSKVKLTAAMGALGSQSRDNIRANVGATGNAPYKLVDIFENPVGDSHYFEIVFPADKLPNGLPMDVEVEVSSSPKTGTDARAIIFGINTYK